MFAFTFELSILSKLPLRLRLSKVLESDERGESASSTSPKFTLPSFLYSPFSKTSSPSSLSTSAILSLSCCSPCLLSRCSSRCCKPSGVPRSAQPPSHGHLCCENSRMIKGRMFTHHSLHWTPSLEAILLPCLSAPCSGSFSLSTLPSLPPFHWARTLSALSLAIGPMRADMEEQERGDGKEELEDKGDLNTGECLKGDCLRGEWGIGERRGLLGEVKPEVESVVSRSSLASCQHRGTPNLLKLLLDAQCISTSYLFTPSSVA